VRRGARFAASRFTRLNHKSTSGSVIRGRLRHCAKCIDRKLGRVIQCAQEDRADSGGARILERSAANADPQQIADLRTKSDTSWGRELATGLNFAGTSATEVIA